MAAAGQRPSPLHAALALRGPRCGIHNPNGAGEKKVLAGKFAWCSPGSVHAPVPSCKPHALASIS